MTRRLCRDRAHLDHVHQAKARGPGKALQADQQTVHASVPVAAFTRKNMWRQ